MSFSSWTLHVLLAYSLCLTCASAEAVVAARATNESQLPKILAIQKRPYLLKNELDLHVAYLPQDYFTNYSGGGATLTHYFTDYLGWEVVNGNAVTGASTGLEDFVRKNGAVPEGFDIMRWYATSNLVYTPMYMKNLFMKSRIVWGDISLVAGYGTASFRDAKEVPVIDAGFLFRFFSSEKVAIKLDVRELTFLSGSLKPNLAIALGVSYNFGSVDFSAAPSEDE